MESGILISVNLPGRLGTRVEHTTYQKYTVETLSEKVKGQPQHPIIVTRNILHTNRTPSTCIREMHISPQVLTGWVEGPCPYQINLKLWKKMTQDQRIAARVALFDEGYGVKYE